MRGPSSQLTQHLSAMSSSSRRTITLAIAGVAVLVAFALIAHSLAKRPPAPPSPLARKKRRPASPPRSVTPPQSESPPRSAPINIPADRSLRQRLLVEAEIVRHMNCRLMREWLPPTRQRCLTAQHARVAPRVPLLYYHPGGGHAAPPPREGAGPSNVWRRVVASRWSWPLRTDVPPEWKVEFWSPQFG